MTQRCTKGSDLTFQRTPSPRVGWGRDAHGFTVSAADGCSTVHAALLQERFVVLLLGLEMRSLQMPCCTPPPRRALHAAGLRPAARRSGRFLRHQQVMSPSPTLQAAPAKHDPQLSEREPSYGTDSALSKTLAVPASGVQLRGYQATGVAAILAAIKPALPLHCGSGSAETRDTAALTTPARILYTLPTGGGKTVVLTAVAHAVAAAGGRCLILVHREELIDQIVKQLWDRGVECGTIAASYRLRLLEAVQVAMVQKLIRRLDRDYGEFDLVIVDEAHRAVANTYQSVISRWPAAALLGSTATPVRLDGVPMSQTFDTFLDGPSMSELVELGHLVPPAMMLDVDAISIDTRGLAMNLQGTDYKPADLAKRAGAVTGDVVRQFRKSAVGRRAIVFTVDCAHCEAVAASFCADGFRAEALSGRTPPHKRREILQRVRDGRTQILVNVLIATEGLDVPEFDAVVMLRPTRSIGLYLQMLGRGLRASPGKTDCLVLDHAGNVALHGLPRVPVPVPRVGVPTRESGAGERGEQQQRYDGSSCDPSAELVLVRACALVEGTGRRRRELMSASEVVRRGLRFEHASYRVQLRETNEPGAMWRATCRRRSTILWGEDRIWSKACDVQLAELLSVPSHRKAQQHAVVLMGLIAGKKLRADRAAARLIEQWGDLTMARLLCPGVEQKSKGLTRLQFAIFKPDRRDARKEPGLDELRNRLDKQMGFFLYGNQVKEKELFPPQLGEICGVKHIHVVYEDG